MIEPIKSGSFTYSHPGGLLNSNVPRADKKTLTQYLNPVRPPRKQTWVPPKLTGKWCKAQLAHYGIKPLSGSKQELENRLREAYSDGLLKKQPLEMKLLEKYMKAEWRSKKESETASAAAAVRTKTSFKKDIVSDDDEIIFKSEEKVKLEFVAPIAPLHSTTATTATAAGTSTSNALRKSGASNFTKKHLFGTWDVTCPAIPSPSSELTFTLMQDSTSQTVVGELDFGVFDGVWRLKAYPSARNHTVGFRWIGRGDGDGDCGGYGEVDGGDGEITFFDRGFRARGRFEEIEGVGRGVRFEARKIAASPVLGKVDWEVYDEGDRGRVGGGRLGRLDWEGDWEGDWEDWKGSW